MAIIALVAFILYLNNTIPELNLVTDYKLFAILGVAIIGLGLLITWISTYFATQRFLNLRTDELYY